MSLDISTTKKTPAKPKRTRAPRKVLNISSSSPQSKPGELLAVLLGVLSVFAFLIAAVGAFVNFWVALGTLGFSVCSFPTLYYRGQSHGGVAARFPRLASFAHVCLAVFYLCVITPSTPAKAAPSITGQDRAYADAFNAYLKIRATHAADATKKIDSAKGKGFPKAVRSYIDVVGVDWETNYAHIKVPPRFVKADELLRAGHTAEIEGYKAMLTATNTKSQAAEKRGSALLDEGSAKIDQAVESARAAMVAP